MPYSRRPRSQARALALQVLYLLEMRDGLPEAPLRDDPLEELLDEVALELLSEEAQQPARSADATRDYARTLIQGVLRNREEIDRQIISRAENWTIERMAVIDRNVLRIGCLELLLQDDVPPKVAIDEAVELGKTFSTERTGAFVNGVLDALHKADSAS